jgi:low temperature requirement protein LtrA
MSPSAADRRSLLRERGPQGGGKVGMVELFFDLVFVFAVTQLSHALLAEMSAANALRSGVLLLAVWWVWIYTTWVLNWLDPERLPVRIGLFALMFAGLLLSAALPEAFAAKGGLFAAAFVFMQVGRSLFMVWALRGERPASRRNFQRITVWLAASGLLWIAGGVATGPERLAWWCGALAVEMLGPWLFFHVPGLGRSTIADWDVHGGHLAERCALFVIIALGESLLVTGATFASQPMSGLRVAAFVTAFVGSVAMWWLYFDVGAERAEHRISQAADPGRQARLAYTYLHLPIVAGIIVGAVGDELVLAHPEHADDAGITAILAGPALFILGTALFKWATHTRRWPPLSHLVGLALLAALAVPAFGHAFSALGLGIACAAVLVLVAGWEHVAVRRRGAAMSPDGH